MDISANALIKLIELDPDWIEKRATAENPVNVQGFCNLDGSPIRRLSPFIHFHGNLIAGGEDDGMSASFRNCPNLENAAGTFDGRVDFDGSPKLWDIHPKFTAIGDESGNAASFQKCLALKIGRGIYYGAVRFNESGLVEIDEQMRVIEANGRGTAMSVAFCKFLIVLRGKYPGWVNASHSGVQETLDLEITNTSANGRALSLINCKQLRRVSGKFHGNVTINDSTVKAINDIEFTDAKDTCYLEVIACPELNFCQEHILKEPHHTFDPKSQRNELIARATARNAMKGNPLEI